MDFQVFSDRLVKHNHAFLFIADCVQVISQWHCKVMNAADLKDAYYVLRLALYSDRSYGKMPFTVYSHIFTWH